MELNSTMLTRKIAKKLKTETKKKNPKQVKKMGKHFSEVTSLGFVYGRPQTT